VSAEVHKNIVGAGSTERISEAWRIKEKIRQRQEIFYQSRDFFFHIYESGVVYQYLNPQTNELIGFSIIGDKGYLLFIAVTPEHHGEGYGKKLIDWLVDDHGALTCHVRTTNTNAIGFYNRIGFEHLKTVEEYYSDDADAYYIAYDPHRIGGIDTIPNY